MPALIAEIAEALLDRGDGRTRVAVDGAEGLDPGALGESLAVELRGHGRAAIHVSTDDFLLPASQRYEQGKTNPDSFYLGWRDEKGLRREVLDPAGPNGNGQVLPRLWRADVDRSARADYVELPESAVVVVSGQFLIGGGLPFDYAVHLEAS